MKYSQLKARINFIKRHGYYKWGGSEMYMRRWKFPHDGEILNVGHWISNSEVIHLEMEYLGSMIYDENFRANMAIKREIQKLNEKRFSK